MDAVSLTWSFIKRLAFCMALLYLLHYIIKTPVTTKDAFYLLVITFLYWFFDTLLVKISAAIQVRDEKIQTLHSIIAAQNKHISSYQPAQANTSKAATGKTTKLSKQEREDESTRYRY